MDLRIAHSLYRALHGDRCVFAYSGAFHDEHTARLIALGEAALGDADLKPNARGRLAFIMVEAYQNILRHRAALPPQLERGEGRSLFLLRCSDRTQQVVAVNPVHKDQVPGLHRSLRALHGMDPRQLKSLFLSGLQRNSDSPRRGAGLGLIEMARRSGSDLGFALNALGPDHELFILAVRIGTGDGLDALLAGSEEMQRTMARSDVLLFHLGERPVAMQEAVLRMVEADVGTEDDRGRPVGRAYMAVNGCLDVATSATGRSLFALSREGDHFALTAGKPASPAAAAALLDHVQRIRDHDRSELERQYRNALLKREGATANVDLLDLARMSVEPLEAIALPLDTDDMLLLIRAVV